VDRAVPELAAAVRARFDAHRHKTLATLRADGSPRISGTEATFVGSDLWLGAMPGSRKALDLQRDPRLALHSSTADETMAEGDAKLSGRAFEVDDPAAALALLRAQQPGTEEPVSPGAFHLFRVDVSEIALVRIGDPSDHLVIERWNERDGYERVERR
jgi:nitroimidazol reductase NimA-like FMN-containing flavoprotein (pyridoxamine 5'-phosphate oxidase superfamily)